MAFELPPTVLSRAYDRKHLKLNTSESSWTENSTEGKHVEVDEDFENMQKRNKISLIKTESLEKKITLLGFKHGPTVFSLSILFYLCISWKWRKHRGSQNRISELFFVFHRFSIIARKSFFKTEKMAKYLILPFVPFFSEKVEKYKRRWA